MKLLPMDFPDLSETPLQRKLLAWKREDEYQRREAMRLWQELREKVEKLPTLMDAAEQTGDDTIDGSAVWELLYEIEQIRRKLSIDVIL